MEKTRRLGDTDIEITAIGYGCMGQTHAYGVVEAEDDMVALMRYAHEVGYTFLTRLRFMEKQMSGILERQLRRLGKRQSLPQSSVLWMNPFLRGMRMH